MILDCLSEVSSRGSSGRALLISFKDIWAYLELGSRSMFFEELARRLPSKKFGKGALPSFSIASRALLLEQQDTMNLLISEHLRGGVVLFLN